MWHEITYIFTIKYSVSGRCSTPSAPFLSSPVSCFDGKDDAPHDLQGKSRHGGSFYKLKQTDYLFGVIKMS